MLGEQSGHRTGRDHADGQCRRLRLAGRLRPSTANLKEGVRILIQHWYPGVSNGDEDEDSLSWVESGLILVPLHLHAPMMALVRLPDHLNIDTNSSGRKTSTDAKRIQDYFYSCNVEIPVKCVRGVLYCRVSCHLYNTAGDFETLAHVAKRMPP